MRPFAGVEFGEAPQRSRRPTRPLSRDVFDVVDAVDAAEKNSYVRTDCEPRVTKPTRKPSAGPLAYSNLLVDAVALAAADDLLAPSFRPHPRRNPIPEHYLRTGSKDRSR